MPNDVRLKRSLVSSIAQHGVICPTMSLHRSDGDACFATRDSLGFATLSANLRYR